MTSTEIRDLRRARERGDRETAERIWNHYKELNLEQDKILAELNQKIKEQGCKVSLPYYDECMMQERNFRAYTDDGQELDLSFFIRCYNLKLITINAKGFFKNYLPLIDYINTHADSCSIDYMDSDRFYLVGKRVAIKYTPIDPQEHNTKEKPAAYDKLEGIVDSYIKKRENKKNSNGKTKEYLLPSFFGFFGKSFTQKQEAVEALKKALNGDDVDLISHLETLRDGRLGDEIEKFIKDKRGDANIIINTRAETVTDFIFALQQKVNAFNSVNKPQIKLAKP